jgi:hypothetical protein
MMRGEDGPLGYDVLLDNEPWPDGARIVTEWPWPWEGQAYGIRSFSMMLPSK